MAYHVRISYSTSPDSYRRSEIDILCCSEFVFGDEEEADKFEKLINNQFKPGTFMITRFTSVVYLHANIAYNEFMRYLKGDG